MRIILIINYMEHRIAEYVPVPGPDRPRRDDMDAMRDSDQAAIARMGEEPTDPAEPDDGMQRPRVQRIARRYTVKAMRRLIQNIDSADPRASTAAAVEVLNRGWGKAPATLAVTQSGAALSNEDLQRELNRRLGELAAKYPGAEIVLNPNPMESKG